MTAAAVAGHDAAVPTFGQHVIDSVIACVIRDEARRAGVPEFIAMGIAGAESGWDPDALGDSGLSYGLFQLYTGDGQGSPYADNPEVLFNPRLNARVAMGPIAAAYASCQESGLSGSNLIACTATGSGHPGPVSWTDSRVRRIVRIALELIFLPDGRWATWPPFDPGVCAGVTIPDAPPPPSPSPLPDFQDLDPVEPPDRAEAGVSRLDPVEPP